MTCRVSSYSVALLLTLERHTTVSHNVRYTRCLQDTRWPAESNTRKDMSWKVTEEGTSTCVTWHSQFQYVHIRKEQQVSRVSTGPLDHDCIVRHKGHVVIVWTDLKEGNVHIQKLSCRTYKCHPGLHMKMWFVIPEDNYYIDKYKDSVLVSLRQ